MSTKVRRRGHWTHLPIPPPLLTIPPSPQVLGGAVLLPFHDSLVSKAFGSHWTPCQVPRVCRPHACAQPASMTTGESRTYALLETVRLALESELGESDEQGGDFQGAFAEQDRGAGRGTSLKPSSRRSTARSPDEQRAHHQLRGLQRSAPRSAEVSATAGLISTA